MAYFPDLSSYSYFTRLSQPNLLNVGWLEPGHDFAAGDVEDEVVQKLLQACRAKREAQTRGLHRCGFCPRDLNGLITVNIDGEPFRLGSAEIRIAGENSVIYAAPNLIYHYITVHRYLPPAEFLAAILRS